MREPVSFLGESLHGKHPAAIVQSGMTMVPEGRRVFARTSVIDNIRLGGYFRKDRAEMKKDMEKMFEMFPRLYERKGQMAGTLSRRRTADAGHRQSPHVKTQAAAAG